MRVDHGDHGLSNTAVAAQVLDDPTAERAAFFAQDLDRHGLAIHRLVRIDEGYPAFVVGAQ